MWKIGGHTSLKIRLERGRLGQNPKISLKCMRSMSAVKVSVLQAQRVACGIMFHLALEVGY
jgi:hypothetical protein